jgi:hypothetical protein
MFGRLKEVDLLNAITFTVSYTTKCAMVLALLDVSSSHSSAKSQNYYYNEVIKDSLLVVTITYLLDAEDFQSDLIGGDFPPFNFCIWL